MAQTPINVTLANNAATLIFQTTSDGTAINYANRIFWAGTPGTPKVFTVIVPATPGIYVCTATATSTTGGVLLPASGVWNLPVYGNDTLYLIAASSTPSVGLVVAGQ